MEHCVSDIAINLFRRGVVCPSFNVFETLKDQMFLKILVHFLNIVPQMFLIGGAEMAVDGGGESGQRAVKQSWKRKVDEHALIIRVDPLVERLDASMEEIRFQSLQHEDVVHMCRPRA
jgi:hypothetical protein